MATYSATAHLFIDISELEGTELDLEIVVDFQYWEGQKQTRWEPGYGPEVEDFQWRIKGAEDVALPMVVHAALDAYVTDQMLNDPHGWVEKAIDQATGW